MSHSGLKSPHPGLLPDEGNRKCGIVRYCAEFPGIDNHSLKHVRANKGSAGIDLVTIPVFQQNLPQNPAEIPRLLKEKRYFPKPVK